jgi:nucleoside-diphosphate-sugar epimerase
MKVAVTGANGAVGRAIVAVAPSHGVDLIAAVRSEGAAAAVRALDSTAHVVRVSYADDAGLMPAVEGTAAMIHLAGILVERPGSTYETANVETTRRVVQAAARAGVRKIVFVSAIGADARSANRYWRSKADAEALVRASGVPFTVLRVPMLLGPATEAGDALRRRLSHRTIWLLDGGRTVQQPLDVDDLAHAALLACATGVATDRTLDLVGPVAVTAREVVERAARLMGRRVRILPVPARPVRLALRVGRRVENRGRLDALEVLTTDTRLDPGPAARALGIALTSLDRMIQRSLAP